PTAVDPVNDTMSMRGSVARTWAMSLSDAGTMLTTPAGMSVFSAMIRPHRSALHGVSTAGLSTIVLPVARIWPTLLLMISNGKFHGVMAPTTPIGSLTTTRLYGTPILASWASIRSQLNSEMYCAGHRMASASGHSNCAM